MISRSFLATALLLSIRVAAGDEVLTTDGRVLTGEVRFTRSGIRVGHDKPLADKDWSNVRWTKPVYRAMPAGVVLVDGSVVAGQVTALDDHGATIQPAEGDAVVIPVETIARVQFAAIDETRLKPLTDGQVTALLKDGDAFAGTVQSFDGKNLTMDSAVFGPTSFVTGEKLAAVFYHQARRLDGDLRVTLVDGTRVVADKLDTSDVKGDVADHLKISAHGIGEMRLSADRVVDITRRVPGEVDAADLRPLAVDGGPVDHVYAVDHAINGLSTRVIGPPAGRVICVADGSVTVAVPDGCDFFTARAAVPADTVPSSDAKLTVLVDDVPAATVTRYSVDDPATVMVRVAGHRSVRLKVEPATAGHLSAVGLWVDPVFLKHVDRPKPVVPATAPTTVPTTGRSDL